MHRAGAPRFLLVVAIAYLGLAAELLPRESPYFRPWEQVLSDSGDRFQPRVRVTMPGCGDLAHNTWQRRRLTWRVQTFSTDWAGFRNPELPAFPRIVIVGDSYVAGAALDDRETISAVLGPLVGEPVYNFGLPMGAGPVTFTRDPRFLDDPPAVVIWMPAGRALPGGLDHDPAPTPPRSAFGQTLAALDRAQRMFQDGTDELKEGSRLVHAARFGFNGLRDRLMGGWVHPYRELRWRGQPVLALSPRAQERRSPTAARQADALAASLERWRAHLQARGTRLLFAPIPGSATTHPQLFDPRDTPPGEPLFEACLAAARARGLETVDLLAAFRRHPDLYPFLPDDTHWSPAGVRVAAAALADALGR